MIASKIGGGNKLNVENAYMIGETFNYIKGVSNKGELIGRVDFTEGKFPNMCPAIDGAISWNAGSYSPKTGLMYKATQEWCFDLEVVKAERPKDFSGQNYFPEKLGRPVFYKPVERGFERDLRKRLDYWAKLRAERGDK